MLNQLNVAVKKIECQNNQLKSYNKLSAKAKPK